ncbi:MAG: divalent-cation tolerance protein CutA [Oligoflexales bacterium]
MKIIYVPYPDEASAKKAAHTILSQSLAGCCQLTLPVTSLYQWNQKIEQTQEVILWLKTTDQRHSELCAWLQEHHPYDVPCVATLTAECNSSYQQWLNSATSLT